MRILEIINSLTYRGGAQVLMASLSKELSADNDVMVISLAGCTNDSFLNLFKSYNIKFIEIGKKKGFDFKSYSKLRKIIIDYCPEIIHFHLSCLPSYFFAFGLKKKKWKLIETMHSIPGSTLGLFQKKLRDIYLKKNRIKLVAISKTNFNIAKHKYGEFNIYLVENGIELYKGNAAEYKFRKFEFDFAIVARFSEVKNHKFLLESFLKYVRDYNQNSRLLCIGDGPLLEECKLFVREHDIANNVVFLGQIDNVYEYLVKSSILILCSKREGNPMCVLEGLSLNIPVVVTNVGGLPDYIIDNFNGKFVYHFDNAELFDAMRDCYENRIIFSENIELSRNNYSIECCAKKYVNLFKELIDAK